MYGLRSNGVWLETIAPYSLPQVTWRWGDGGGGLDEVTWEMDLPYDYDHPALRRGALVEVMDGALPVGRGLLAEPGRTDTGLSFVLPGIYREAEHYLCLNASNQTTSVTDTAISQAIARGLPWKLPTGGITTNPLVTGDTTDNVNSLSDLLDSLVDELGWRWWVDGDGTVRTGTDTTTPAWSLVPGIVDLAVAEDEYASTLFGRYLDSSTLAYTTVTANDAAAEAMWGHREYAVDMTQLGPITAFRANSRLNGLLAKGKARLAFTDRVVVTSNQLLTLDGAPAPLSMVRGGQMVRAYGLDGDAAILNGRNYVDFVLGEVVDPQDGTLSIGAVDLAARSLSDAFAVVPTTSSFAA